MSWPNPMTTRWIGGPDRPIVEDGLTLTIHKLVKASYGRSWRGTWCWSSSNSDKASATIGYMLVLHDDQAGTLTLDFTWRGEAVHQVITLEARPCRFGGVRWFARCPAFGYRVAKLYMPAGGNGFYSRKAYGMGYRSQTESPGSRASSRRWKLIRRLGSDHPDDFPRPKRMRRRTYERITDRIEREDALWSLYVLARFGNHMAPDTSAAIHRNALAKLFPSSDPEG